MYVSKIALFQFIIVIIFLYMYLNELTTWDQATQQYDGRQLAVCTTAPVYFRMIIASHLRYITESPVLSLKTVQKIAILFICTGVLCFSYKCMDFSRFNKKNCKDLFLIFLGLRYVTALYPLRATKGIQVASVCSYYRNLFKFTKFLNYHQKCKCALKFCQFDKIPIRTSVIAFIQFHPWYRRKHYKIVDTESGRYCTNIIHLSTLANILNLSRPFKFC